MSMYLYIINYFAFCRRESYLSIVANSEKIEHISQYLQTLFFKTDTWPNIWLLPVYGFHWLVGWSLMSVYTHTTGFEPGTYTLCVSLPSEDFFHGERDAACDTSVYTHTTSTHTGFETMIFWSRVKQPKRVATEWGLFHGERDVDPDMCHSYHT